MPAKKINPRTIEREIYAHIREEIVEGTRGPGDGLVEAQIAHEFGVSKTPVREALIRLEREGLATSESSHRSIRVAEPSDDDVSQIYEVSTWIEAAAATRLAREQPPAVLERLRTNLDQSRVALDGNRRTAAIATTRAFTDIMVGGIGNRFAVDWLVRLDGILAIAATASRRVSGRLDQSIAEHQAIYDAIIAGDEPAAAEAVRVHLESLRDQCLAGLRGVDDDGPARQRLVGGAVNSA